MAILSPFFYIKQCFLYSVLVIAIAFNIFGIFTENRQISVKLRKCLALIEFNQ